MNWFTKQYKEVFPFYFIISGLWVFFGPWYKGPLWLDWLGVMFAAYLALTVFLVLQVLWVSIFRKKKE